MTLRFAHLPLVTRRDASHHGAWPQTACALLVAVVVALWLGADSARAAATADETTLAKRFSPVLVVPSPDERRGGCDRSGDLPVAVDNLLGSPDVALRGPWTGSVVKVAPTVEDIDRGLPYYALDMPGDPLSPGCTYAEFSKRIVDREGSTIYAHIVTDTAHRKVALQYWFFYVFNDWRNRHEGDWEMIQLTFDAPSVAEALDQSPEYVSFSQHEGNETRDWDDYGVDVQDDTHIVVYPSPGSHANYFTSGVYVGRGGAEGLGCDDTSMNSTDIRPAVSVLGADQRWLGFEGRWGELRPNPFNGPTGPNMKKQWTQPVDWAKGKAHSSSQISGSGSTTSMATGFFCNAIKGSADVATQALRDPQLAILVGMALVAGLLAAITRTTWTPSQPLRVVRRRSVGQIVVASMRMYGRSPRIFMGLGLLVLAASAVGAALQWIGTLPVGSSILVLLVTVGYLIGLLMPFAGFALVAGSVARAVMRHDADEPRSLRAALPRPLSQWWKLAIVGLPVVIVQVLFNISPFMIPIGLAVMTLTALAPVVMVLEGRSVMGSLRRSARLALVNPGHAALMAIIAVGIGLLSGPTVGVLTVVATGLPFWLLNLIAGVVYVIALSLAGVMLTYLYADLVTRATDEDDLLSDAVLPAQARIPAAEGTPAV